MNGKKAKTARRAASQAMGLLNSVKGETPTERAVYKEMKHILKGKGNG